MICNEGEHTVEALTDGYKPVMMKYHVAEVTKALCPIGQMCYEGAVLVLRPQAATPTIKLRRIRRRLHDKAIIMC